MAVVQGRLDVVKDLLKQGPNVGSFTTNRSIQSGKALQAAYETGKDNIVGLLLVLGYDENKISTQDPLPGRSLQRREEQKTTSFVILFKQK